MARRGGGTIKQIGQLPMFVPESDWQAPTELPDLSAGVDALAIDTENKDDGLAAGVGSGWVHRAGYVAGVGVAWRRGEKVESVYLPLNHPDTKNLDKDRVARWITSLVQKNRTIFQNAPYDLGWLGADMGVPTPVGIDDTVGMGVMLDENRLSYSLDSLCEWQGVPGKDEALLRDAADAFSLDPKKDLWRLPARFVGPYGAQDAVSTLLLADQMRKKLEAQEVWDAYQLEMDLVPMVLDMRRRGIRIDMAKAEKTAQLFEQQAAEALKELSRKLMIGREVTIKDINSPMFLERIFAAEGIPFPRTEHGQGSFQKEWMEKYDHWLPKLVVRASNRHNAATKFVRGFLMDYAHRGRIHAEVNQFRGTDQTGVMKGTRSYRFSYSDPALQQMPSPDMQPEVGSLIRDLLLADEGELWLAADYSQQEYRLTAHFAALVGVPGGEEAARQYIENPDLDYHQLVADWSGETRARAKIINFAVLYGQGIAATAAKLGASIEEAEQLQKTIKEKAPFGPALDDYVRRVASRRGYIRLLDGARCRFDMWESGWLEKSEHERGWREHHKMGPCSLEEARARKADPNHPWHTTYLRRADTRKAMNRLIQGSAARQTKMAMREAYREKIVPLLQMHDELGASVGSAKVGARLVEIMRDVVKLKVPMKVDSGYGRSWTQAKTSKKTFAQAMRSKAS